MDVVTQVSGTKKFDKQLAKVPDFIRDKVRTWIFLVESTGIWEVAKSPGFHDEPLKGDRKGQRSASWRFINMITKNSSYFEKLEKKHGKLTFGAMLKSWREAEGISQTAFAKKIGFSPQNLNDLENGRRIPTPSRAAKIAKKLGLPVMGLIELALRDSLIKEGFKFEVKLKAS